MRLTIFDNRLDHHFDLQLAIAAILHQEDHRHCLGSLHIGKHSVSHHEAVSELLGSEYEETLGQAIRAVDFVVQSTFLTMMIAVTGVSWAYNVLAITLVASVPA